MKARWRIALPMCGLVMFAAITHRSIVENRALVHNEGRYFWWSGIRLDSDPLNNHSKRPALRLRSDTAEDCFVDPLDVWVDPGWITRCLVISALPAFLIGVGTVYGLAKGGSSEVATFMASMPLLIVAWFYLVGWFLDRSRIRRRA